MIILLIIIMLIISVIINIHVSYDNVAYFITVISVIASVLALVIVAACLIMILIESDNIIIEYNNLKIIIDNDYNNLTPMEKVSIINKALELNNTISNHKYWAEDIWFCVFTNKHIKDLPLFDLVQIIGGKE